MEKSNEVKIDCWNWLIDLGFKPETGNGMTHIHFTVEDFRFDLWPTTNRMKVRQGNGINVEYNSYQAIVTILSSFSEANKLTY
jgi:hypothetical protein